MALRFESERGRGSPIRVLEGGLVVRKIDPMLESGYGAAFTDRPLRTSEVFGISILDSKLHWLSFGITSNPKEVGMSTHMEERSATWMLRCSYFIQMKVKGEKVQDIPYDEVRPLRGGNQLTLMVTPKGELLFFLNEKQLGNSVGITTSAESLYGFIEMFGRPGSCVRLIPDLTEEKRHLAICNKMIQTRGTITITLLHGMFSGPPRVGKSTMLSRLFGLKPSQPALPHRLQ